MPQSRKKRRSRRKQRPMDTREAGKKGGRARAKELSGERRREIASLGGKAAKEARRIKAEEKQRKKNRKQES